MAEPNVLNGVNGLVERERLARVLVVDDRAYDPEMLTIGLNYEGFEVSIARDGDEALRQAAAHKPDVVILDVMLPAWTALKCAGPCAPAATWASSC